MLAKTIDFLFCVSAWRLGYTACFGGNIGAFLFWESFILAGHDIDD
jgi:hypothetical protein